jgi:hypothetical protein
MAAGMAWRDGRIGVSCANEGLRAEDRGSDEPLSLTD